MTKVLRADFFRLFKSRAFLVGLIATVSLTLLNIITGFIDFKNNPESYEGVSPLNDYIFSINMLIPIILSAVVPVFLGNDYKDGTIRNKLVTGHSRLKLYLSELIITVSLALIYLVAFFAVVLCVGMPLLGTSDLGFDVILKNYLVIIGAIVSFSAIFTFFGLVLNSKSTIIVFCMISTFIMLIVGVMIGSMLSEPERYVQPAMTVSDGNGGTRYIEEINEPNPNYVDGFKRDVLEVFDTVLPYDQVIRATNLDIEGYTLIMPACSAMLTLIFSGAGIMIFRKKNIK